MTGLRFSAFILAVSLSTGAAGMIGLEFASKQPGDGYTIVLGNTGAIAINPSVYSKLSYDPVEDFVAIGRTTTNALLCVIGASVPANNLREFIAYAKVEKPGSEPDYCQKKRARLRGPFFTA